MLSKRKIAEVVMASIRDRLEDDRSRGVSLKDDTDGISVRVDQIRQSGTLIFFNILTTDESVDDVRDVEYCLQLQQKVPAELPILPTGGPSAEDLAAIDNTP